MAAVRGAVRPSTTVGTKIGHGQNPDITECTCLTKPWRRQRFFQCFTRTDIPSDCPIHSSKGSTVGNKANSNEKQKDTTKQPGLVRRLGRWIAKKVTDGKKEEPEESTHAISATDDISPQPGSYMLLYYLSMVVAGSPGSKATGINETKQDTTDNVAQAKEKKTELDNNDMESKCEQPTVMSLKEICKAVNAYSVDLNLNTDNLKSDDTGALENHDINETEQDSTSLTTELNDSVLMTLVQLSTNINDSDQDTATDVAQPKATNTELDNNDKKQESYQNSVMSLKQMCKAVVTYSDDLKLSTDNIKAGHTEEIDNHEIKKPDQDNTSLRSEFDKSVLTILVQLSTSIYDSNQDIANDKDQPKATNTELDNNDKKQESYQNTVMSLQEMCKAVMTYSNDLKSNTDSIKFDDTEDLDNHETNEPEQDNTRLMTVVQHSTKSVSNNDGKETNDKDDKDRIKQPKTTNTELDNDDKKRESCQNTVMSLHEMCKAVVAYSNDMKPNTDSIKFDDTEDLDNHETSEPEQNNTSLTTVVQPFTKGISNSDGKETNDKDDKARIKQPKATNTELDNNDKKQESYQNTVMSLHEMCKAVMTYSNDLKPNTDNIKCDDTEDLETHETSAPKQDNTSLTTVVQLSTKGVSNTDGKEAYNKYDKDRIKQPTATNTELDNDERKQISHENTVMSLKDICKTALKYPHDLKQSTNARKTDHTEYQEGHEKESSELDNTKINSELEDGVLMTPDKTKTDVELILSAKSLLRHMEDNYNEVGLQRGIYYQRNMDEEVADKPQTQACNIYTISDKVHTLHTFADNCHYLPVIDQKSMRKGKVTESKQVDSHAREKAGKGKGKYNIAELLGLGAKPHPNLRNIENNHMIPAAKKKLSEDFNFTSQTTKISTTNQTAYDVQRLSDKHKEAEGTEGDIYLGSKNGPMKEVGFSSESHVEHHKGTGRENDTIKGTDLSSESHVRPNLGLLGFP